MKTNKLKTMSTKSLQSRLGKLTKEVVDLKFNIRIGQEKDYSTLGRKKKELASIKTLLHANSLGIYTLPEIDVEKDDKVQDKNKKKEVTVKVKKEKKAEEK